MSDLLDQLPTSSSLSMEEQHLAEQLFANLDDGLWNKITKECQRFSIPIICFIILSFPALKEFIYQHVKLAQSSDQMMIVVQVAIFTGLLIFITYWKEKS